MAETPQQKIEKLLKREQNRLDAYKKINDESESIQTLQDISEQQDKVIGILMALQEIL